MFRILLVSLTVSSLLFSSDSDLACKKVPVSIFYSGYQDINNNQKYIYFDGQNILDITPPASIHEQKSIEVITSKFSSKPSIIDNGLNIKIPTPNDASHVVSHRLNDLGTIPVSIYYASYKDSNNSQMYVYFDGQNILDITPPKNINESKTINVITNKFTSKPTFDVDSNDCNYDVGLDGWYDSNFVACVPNTTVNLSFKSLIGGESCYIPFDFLAWGIDGDAIAPSTTVRINGILYTVKVYSPLDINQTNSEPAIVLNGTVNGKNLSQLKINADYGDEHVKLKFFASDSVFDDSTLIAESASILANGTLVNYENVIFNNPNDYSVPQPSVINGIDNPPASPVF